MGLLLTVILSLPGFPVCPGMSIELAERIFNEKSALTVPLAEGIEQRTYFGADVAIGVDEKGRIVSVFWLRPAPDQFPPLKRDIP